MSTEQPEGRATPHPPTGAGSVEGGLSFFTTTYLRVRAVMGSTAFIRTRRESVVDKGGSRPFEDGRDPRDILSIMQELTATMGWESPLARSELMVRWPEIVGREVAQHTEPLGVEGGQLTVRCDSTAWAMQLRTMKTMVVTKIQEDHPQAGIFQVRFIGPDVPSWNKGPRSIRGRGPRDTYG